MISRSNLVTTFFKNREQIDLLLDCKKKITTHCTSWINYGHISTDDNTSINKQIILELIAENTREIPWESQEN